LVHVDSQLYAFTFVVEKIFNFSQIETHVMVNDEKNMFLFLKDMHPIYVLFKYILSVLISFSLIQCIHLVVHLQI